MYPIELANALRVMEGRLLNDVDVVGGAGIGRSLAPCCGRIVQSVRWLNGQRQRVQLLFEPPELWDEPDALLLDPAKVREVTVWKNVVHLAMGEQVVQIEMGQRKEAEPLNDAALRMLRWSVQEKEGVLMTRDVMSYLGIKFDEADRFCRELLRVGLLRPCGRGNPRRLTPRAVELAESAVGEKYR